MPAPRVFVSSTFYDLRYVRENLKYFIGTLGFQPVLSEDGNVFYDPNIHVHDAALAEVPSCQMFVLIIGGRSGSPYVSDPVASITNNEYREATKAKIPIFALVQRDVYEQYHVYRANIVNENVDEKEITYPGVETYKVFDFIREVQGQSINNALVPFSNFQEMQNYLQQQWASMMHNYLTSESEAKRVADMISAIGEVGQKIEYLTEKLVQSVGSDRAKIAGEMYNSIIEASYTSELDFYDTKPVPEDILRAETFRQYLTNAGYTVTEGTNKNQFTVINISDESGRPRWGMVRRRFEEDEEGYANLRAALENVLLSHNMTLSDFLDGSAR